MKIKGDDKVVSVSGAPHDEEEAQAAENDENAESAEDMIEESDMDEAQEAHAEE